MSHAEMDNVAVQDQHFPSRAITCKEQALIGALELLGAKRARGRSRERVTWKDHRRILHHDMEQANAHFPYSVDGIFVQTVVSNIISIFGSCVKRQQD